MAEERWVQPRPCFKHFKAGCHITNSVQSIRNCWEITIHSKSISTRGTAGIVLTTETRKRMPYTKRELKLWEAAKAFIAKVNAKLASDPTLVLFHAGTPVKTREIVEHIFTPETDDGYEDKWLAYIIGPCTQGVFCLNESCDESIKDIKAELKANIKIYKEVRI